MRIIQIRHLNGVPASARTYVEGRPGFVVCPPDATEERIDIMLADPRFPLAASGVRSHHVGVEFCSRSGEFTAKELAAALRTLADAVESLGGE